MNNLEDRPSDFVVTLDIADAKTILKAIDGQVQLWENCMENVRDYEVSDETKEATENEFFKWFNALATLEFAINNAKEGHE